MIRALWPYFLFATVAAAISLWVSLNPSTETPGKSWEAFKFEEIKEVLYQDKQKKVQVIPIDPNYSWIEVTSTGRASEKFMAGPRSKDFWFTLSPIWATKTLGLASNLKLADFGFDQNERILTIALRNGDSKIFVFGGRGFKSEEYYVLDKQRGEVFQWNRQFIETLENPSRYLSLEKLDFAAPNRLKSAALTFSGGTRHLIRENGQWSEDDKPVVEDNPFLKWLERLSQTKVESFRQAGSQAGEPLFSLEIDGETPGRLQVYFDSQAQSYSLSFGADFPNIVLDGKSFTALHEELKQGKIVAKN